MSFDEWENPFLKIRNFDISFMSTIMLCSFNFNSHGQHNKIGERAGKSFWWAFQRWCTVRKPFRGENHHESRYKEESAER